MSNVKMDTAVSAHQRKIELQAPEDLTYLLANIRRAAAERINEAFPPVEGAQGEDELRNSIEELIEEVRLFHTHSSRAVVGHI